MNQPPFMSQAEMDHIKAQTIGFEMAAYDSLPAEIRAVISELHVPLNCYWIKQEYEMLRFPPEVFAQMLRERHPRPKGRKTR